MLIPQSNNIDDYLNEVDYKTICVENIAEVIEILSSNASLTEVNKNLPDKISTIS